MNQLVRLQNQLVRLQDPSPQGQKLWTMEKRKLTPEEEAEQEERLPKKKKGRPDTSLDEERIRLSALLEEKGYDFDAVLLWSVPQMAAELDRVQQQEQAAAASKAKLGPMKNSTMDMHVRDIKAKIAKGELPSIEQIQAPRASLNLGLGLGGGATIEFPISGSGIREGEEVMCGEVTKAMFPNMFPLNPKEEPASPPSSPSMDNMTISSVIKIKKASTTEDAGPQPTATTDAAVGSNVEDQQARDKRNQAIAQDKPRFRRRKSMARRKKRTTAISSDSEPDTDTQPSEPKDTPKPPMPKDHPRDLYGLNHHHTYIPIVKWSFDALHKVFTLIQVNGGIKVLELTQLMVLAEPFIFDLDKLPLDNPDNGSDGRVGVKWVKTRAQYKRLHRQTAFGRKEFLFGSNIASEVTKGFRRLTASEDSLLHPKTKTSEVYTLTKTVAEHFYSTKGTDNRRSGLRTTRINIPKVRYNTLLLRSCIKCKRLSEALKINNIKCLLYLASLCKVNVYTCNDCK
ncbi:hypothetical protein E3N88_01742 [Mikania micrantha]|uniref:Uncharacterized protein n=1 Tax=Mikania micrantha TaxID=192012 RepID=A0A5N6Q3F1_9ASTR|nr:hypothetical protein E3N88_01742 [Mikania micrantha]